MNQSFEEMCAELEQEIIQSYTQTISIPQAENLAGKFLTAQCAVSQELRNAALDARMRKSGVKAIAASVFLNSIKSQDKKPSDGVLNAIVDQDELVAEAREGHDKADVYVQHLERYYDIFREAHIFYRGQAKQNYG